MDKQKDSGPMFNSRVWGDDTTDHELWAKRARYIETFIMSSGPVEATDPSVLADFVYRSNMLEKTFLRSVTAQDVLSIVRNIPLSDDPTAFSPGLWDVEGGSSNLVAQTTQFCRAYRFLCRHHLCSPLRPDLIQKTHAIMFRGAQSDPTDPPFFAGQFRQTGAHPAGDLYSEYVRPEDIKFRLTGLCDYFNASERSAAEQKLPNVFFRTARLVGSFLEIHPFQNGNGRLARLLGTFALERAGLAGPVVLGGTGRTKDRKHWITCLQRAQNGSLGPLATLILDSVWTMTK